MMWCVETPAYVNVDSVWHCLANEEHARAFSDLEWKQETRPHYKIYSASFNNEYMHHFSFSNNSVQQV